MSALKHLRNTTLVLLALVVAACNGSDARLLSIADLKGSCVAVLDNAVSDSDFKRLLPGSNARHFKSSSEFLLALSIGKCDAGITNYRVPQVVSACCFIFLSAFCPQNINSFFIYHHFW